MLKLLDSVKAFEKYRQNVSWSHFLAHTVHEAEQNNKVTVAALTADLTLADSGKLFHTFTILLVKNRTLTPLHLRLQAYNLYAWPIVCDTEKFKNPNN